ncbi:formin-like protein 20 [Schistocerca americana]|uniref:formin-like protein 20 n=1 Tax=Schistocerca americana TaxID=7009 RepID=UPI001F5015F8|nr:formin-like protein 20 [Schistocerca americana]
MLACRGPGAAVYRNRGEDGPALGVARRIRMGPAARSLASSADLNPAVVSVAAAVAARTRELAFPQASQRGSRSWHQPHEGRGPALRPPAAPPGARGRSPRPPPPPPTPPPLGGSLPRNDLVRGGFQPRLPTSLPPPGQQQQPSPLPRRQPVPLMPPAQLHPGAPQVVAPAPAVPLQSPPPSELMDVDPSAGPPSQAVAVQPVLQPLSLGTPKESDTAAPCPAPTQQPSTQRQETLPLFVGPDAPSRPVPEAAPVVTARQDRITRSAEEPAEYVCVWLAFLRAAFCAAAAAALAARRASSGSAWHSAGRWRSARARRRRDLAPEARHLADFLVARVPGDRRGGRAKDAGRAWPAGSRLAGIPRATPAHRACRPPRRKVEDERQPRGAAPGQTLRASPLPLPACRGAH